jgi:hypothetical protein
MSQVEYRNVPGMPEVKGFQIIARSSREANNQLAIMTIRAAALGQTCIYRGPAPYHDDNGDQFIIRGYLEKA